MALDKLYTFKVLKKNNEIIIADISFNPEHNIYKGHFPGLPITPGVCQVKWVKDVICGV